MRYGGIGIFLCPGAVFLLDHLCDAFRLLGDSLGILFFLGAHGLGGYGAVSMTVTPAITAASCTLIGSTSDVGITAGAGSGAASGGLALFQTKIPFFTTGSDEIASDGSSSSIGISIARRRTGGSANRAARARYSRLGYIRRIQLRDLRAGAAVSGTAPAPARCIPDVLPVFNAFR